MERKIYSKTISKGDKITSMLVKFKPTPVNKVIEYHLIVTQDNVFVADFVMDSSDDLSKLFRAVRKVIDSYDPEKNDNIEELLKSLNLKEILKK